MSQRSDREAERLARKTAYREHRQQPPQSAVAAEPPPANTSISEAQLAANRANALRSTGPVTPQGKSVASRNALKTALTGNTILLPTDNAGDYNLRLEAARNQYRPVTEEEQSLVQLLVDTGWRLERIIAIETGIYAKGLNEFADEFEDESPAARHLLIQTETYLKYEKSLRNLNVQEARLQRQRTKGLAELKRLIEVRQRREIAMAAITSTPIRQNGFEFSNSEITPEFDPSVFVPATEDSLSAQS